MGIILILFLCKNMEIVEMINVLNAFKNGERIEYFSIVHNKWIESIIFVWNFDKYKYRIKQQPKYIPFDLSDDLIGKVIKLNNPLKYGFLSELMIIKKTESGVLAADTDWFTYETLLEEYVFVNGDKCGKFDNIKLK